jgi:hypothetical protein
MQIFFGACLFFLAVVLLAYVPGKLLLLFLKRTLSPLEDATLACVLGLVASALVYWLIAFAHQARFYLVWPVATAAVFVWLYGSKRKALLRNSVEHASSCEESAKQSRDRSGLALAGVLALGIVALAFLPFYYTNLTWRTDGTMRVNPVPDVIFHIAIANELTHTIPPQAPVFSGHPLPYHYGIDLLVAMFAMATGLNTADLTVRFVPTLLLALSMLSVFFFSRNWLGSGYFGVLAVFLVFFGEDFSFIPGVLLGEKVDWSLRYFSFPPAVLPLFFTNPILPGVGLLFAGLFCLQRYLQERATAWVFLAALLFVTLIEVKIFTAAHVMWSLGLAALVYLLLFRNADLFKAAALTAFLAMPLVWLVFLNNRSGGSIVAKFQPLLYVSESMEALGMKHWLTGWAPFAGIALPIYLVGCLGLRVIGLPSILHAIFRPDPSSALRFLLAIFVTSGLFIALTFSITPAGWTFAYNPLSGVFLLQSKYVAWIFAVEVLQIFYRRALGRGIWPALTTVGIMATAIGVSVPATVQHFVFWRDPDHVFGSGKPFGEQLLRYDSETLRVMEFLNKNAQPGEVVLAGDNLLAPVLALTKCRVPFGYFAYILVSRSDYTRRETAEKEFWKTWRQGNVQGEFLQQAGVRYVIVSKQTGRIPPAIPAAFAKLFENSKFAVFKVDSERLSETN